MYSVVIDKPNKDGAWAVRKVYTGKRIPAFLKFLSYRRRYKHCSIYKDIYATQFPGMPINEFRYKSMGENEWTYEN